MQLTCPHCGLPALTVFQKLLLGWSRRVSCRACDLQVRVAPLPAVTAMLPCLAVILAASLRWMRDPVTLALSGAGAIVATGALHLWAVPLVKAQVTDPRAVEKARSNSGRA